MLCDCISGTFMVIVKPVIIRIQILTWNFLILSMTNSLKYFELEIIFLRNIILIKIIQPINKQHKNAYLSHNTFSTEFFAFK